MDNVYTHCRSRGADGFAFVIQNEGLNELGQSGMGLGYHDINNSLAVEFDTWHNPEMLDDYENHISVQTRGWRHRNRYVRLPTDPRFDFSTPLTYSHCCKYLLSAHHSFSLGSSTRSSNMADGTVVPGDKQDTYRETDGVHSVKLHYTPIFDENVLMSGRLVTSAYMVNFLENSDYQNGGQADWGTGMGTLAIYVDDMFTPLFVIPLNLADTLALDNGRAYIGFTAATGSETWQVHDILNWEFTATREEAKVYAPPIINKVGGHVCSRPGACSHA